MTIYIVCYTRDAFYDAFSIEQVFLAKDRAKEYIASLDEWKSVDCYIVKMEAK